jgi:hypothetical protein
MRRRRFMGLSVSLLRETLRGISAPIRLVHWEFGFDQVGTVWPQILDCGAELTRSEAKAQSYVLCEFPGNVMLLANPCRYYVDLRSGGGY